MGISCLSDLAFYTSYVPGVGKPEILEKGSVQKVVQQGDPRACAWQDSRRLIKNSLKNGKSVAPTHGDEAGSISLR